MKFNRILNCINPKIKPILSNKISCSQCKFYNPNKTCKMFNEIDTVTINSINSLAKSCREDETKCGSTGIFYREKIKDNIQDEDTSLWNDVKYPMLIYCIVIIVINI